MSQPQNTLLVYTPPEIRRVLIDWYSDDYAIDDQGVFWSKKRIDWDSDLPEKTWKPMQQSLDRHGYAFITLSHPGKPRKMVYTHSTVCAAFHGPNPDPGKYQACHNPGCARTDNRASSLRWDSASANQRDRVLDGTSNRAEQHPLAKLNWQRVRDIREKGARGVPVAILARENNVKPATIYAVLERRTWIEDQHATQDRLSQDRPVDAIATTGIR